ncbi:MAG TPA: hypothetical protein V6C57_07525 [Coleofasciculaceae cyanobacterium]
MSVVKNHLLASALDVSAIAVALLQSQPLPVVLLHGRQMSKII